MGHHHSGLDTLQDTNLVYGSLATLLQLLP